MGVALVLPFGRLADIDNSDGRDTKRLRIIWPRLFCILMGEHDRAGVHGKVWSLAVLPWAGPALQPLTFIDRAWASPTPQSPHFYRQGLGQPRPPQPLTSIGEPLTFIDRP